MPDTSCETPVAQGPDSAPQGDPFPRVQSQAQQFIQDNQRKSVKAAVQVQQQVSRTAGRLRRAVGERVAAASRAFAEQQTRFSSRESGSSADQKRWQLPWGKGRKRGEGFQLGRGKGIKDLIKRAEEHERQLNVREAIKCYETATTGVAEQEAVKLDKQKGFEVLARCSKAISDATYLDEIGKNHRFYEKLSSADKREINQRALVYAEQAIEAGNNRALPHVAACCSKGRMALFSDSRTKARLAKEARDEAEVAVAKEPSHDLGHHLIGRWHVEMAQLNSFVRALIRMALGTALNPGSYPEALEAYLRATQINSRRLIHRVELGRVYAKLGREEEAERELRLAKTLPVEDINAYLQLLDGQAILRSLKQRGRRRGPFGRFGLPQPSDTASADEGGADTERSKVNVLRPWWQNKWPPNTPELHTPPFMLVHHELDRRRL